METKSALVTGISGQDGSYLAELLLKKGYDVYGLVRRLSVPNYQNIEHILPDIHLISGDITDLPSLTSAVTESMPDEIYHLAAQSFVAASWEQPVLTSDVTGIGTLRVLDAAHNYDENIRIYNASSSEMFGNASTIMQNETTPFNPRSIYGCAKVFGYNVAKNYRESYGTYVASGICFNHESERRGLEFVTRKITMAVAMIANGLQDYLYLGNLDAKRDWGYAPDYVEAMWRMLQQDEPQDYIIATGETHSIHDVCEIAFNFVGMDYTDYVKVDPQFYRPAEINVLCGDASKIEKEIGWKPTVEFEDIVKRVVNNDLNLCRGL